MSAPDEDVLVPFTAQGSCTGVAQQFSLKLCPPQEVVLSVLKWWVSKQDILWYVCVGKKKKGVLLLIVRSKQIFVLTFV